MPPARLQRQYTRISQQDVEALLAKSRATRAMTEALIEMVTEREDRRSRVAHRRQENDDRQALRWSRAST